MRTRLLPILIFLLGIGISKAQEQTVAEVNLTDQLKSLCTLTPEQVSKVSLLVTDFEKKRDDTYKKYRHNPTELKKLVKQNRWDYEVSLIGTLNPEQMGLVKVFDQRNPELMTHESTHFNDVSYFADNTSNTSEQSNASPVAASEQKSMPVAEPVVANKPRMLTSTDSILTHAIRSVCDLSSDQFTKAEPVLADFEIKRDSIYEKYYDNKVALNKAVRKNRLNYEVALVDILTPEQMRILRAFNLSNRALMSGSGTTVNEILFIPGVARLPDESNTSANAAPVADNTSEKAGTTSNSTSETGKQATEIVNLTEQLRELCDLTPDQVTKAGPIIENFEKKRDENYKKYHHNTVVLAKMVKKNRWDYEVSLIGIFNPSQMGLLKVFDQRNPELMTFNSGHVNDVSYFADSK